MCGVEVRVPQVSPLQHAKVGVAVGVSRSGAPGREGRRLVRYRKSRTLQADVLVVHLAVALPLLEPKPGQIQA
jgi:hypothetical protein